MTIFTDIMENTINKKYDLKTTRAGGKAGIKMTNETLEHIIHDTFDSLKNNHFLKLGSPALPLWERPLVGIAMGDDSYYDFLKGHIGEFHWSPLEAFQLKYDEPRTKENLRVVSMIFPQTMETKQAQSKEKKCPSKEWIVSRAEWEPFMAEFGSKLTKRLEEQGIRSVSIDLLQELKVQTSNSLGLASNWSHRHIAYFAGLGTFGLSDGLITKRGKAVRLTSLIIEASLTPTVRPYKSHLEWCLYYKDGSCGACIKRCPADAITLQGHDKDKCDAYEKVFYEKHWPAEITKGDYKIGCGLCQAGVPCQNQKP